MKKEAIIIFGNGIGRDGSLPESTLSCIALAAERYAHNQCTVIACGKWSYKIDYTPPRSEAEAIVDELNKRGVSTKDTRIEDQSVTTISNACLAKKEFILPEHIKSLTLVTLKPLAERALFNLDRVMGDAVVCRVVTSDFAYPAEKAKQLEVYETDMLAEAKRFHVALPRGDHEVILQEATRDLRKNFLPRYGRGR